MKPLVSVIVPLYNAAPYISEALASIVASAYRPIEVVVVDDGSTDNSLTVAQAFAATHPEVRVLHQPNAGVSAARNHAIREAQGEWILPVDADDRISPDYIGHAVAAIEPDVRVIGCRAEFFGAKSGEWKLPEFSRELLARKNMIHISSLFRKADWMTVGGFCQEDIYREDWDFWLSLFESEGRYVRLDEVGLYYRVLPGSRRHTAKAQKRAIVDAMNLRHPAFMERHLGGPLHYMRSWSRFLNRFRRYRQTGGFRRWDTGHVITNHRNIIRADQEVVVKQFAVPGLWRGIWYGWFAKSKAQRSYEYALRLGEDFTPAPVAYREARVFGILRESWYVSRRALCDYSFNDLIGAPDFPLRDEILRRIGRFTAGLHKRGVLHGDYSGGNILFNADGTRIQIVDLNRLRFCGHLTREQRLRNFERLNIDRSALETLARAYAKEMCEDPYYDAEYIISHRWHKHVKQGITNL